LAQCRHFLEENGLSALVEPALSTTHAVELVMKSQFRAGAIANYRAATRYGGEVLASSIQDTSNNITRFIVLGDKETSPTGSDRTSIALWFGDDRPGLLTAVLTEFSSRGINCMKLESRPTRASLGEYVFLIDFEGHIREQRCREALDEISKLATRIKIFGSYPKGIFSS
jgi:prephenate dehydratase